MLCALLLLAACPLQAQDISELLPAKFIRIQTLDELTDDGYYLIGGANRNEGFILLNATLEENNSHKKVGAIRLTDELLNNLVISTPTLIWKFSTTTNTNTYTIASAAGKGNLFAPTQNDTDLTLDQKKATSWIITESATGFTFQNASNNRRFLGINELLNQFLYFGNYTEIGADTIQLAIYKYDPNFAATPGEATQPHDGETIAIGADDIVATAQFQPVAVPHLLLHNGAIAPAEEISSLTASVHHDSFSLQRADGYYLDFNLTFTPTPTWWKISNGYVISSEPTPRYLVYLPAQSRFAVLTRDEATKAKAIGVLLRSIGLPPVSTLTNSLLTLSGAWDANQLAAINWQGVSALDLTALSLPLHTLPFVNQPSRNMPIYINQSDADVVPATWNFVISDAQLLRPTTLIDRQTLHIPHPFFAETNMLTYTRDFSSDGMWETLFLPFDTTVPNGYIAETLSSITDNQLIFEETQTVPANVPVIIRKTSSNQDNPTLTLRCTAGNVMTNASSTPRFFGTYQPLNITSSKENIYLLHKDGTAFVRADAGSSLDPFRAYLKLNSTEAQIMLPFTGIQTSYIKHPKANVYTLDGRIVTEIARRGVYITNGKKILK